MDEKELLLFSVKQYIDRFMYEGSKYQLIQQDRWVKQLYKIVEEQQKKINELNQEISGDTPNCYECGGEIDFDGQYSKFTKTVEISKVINVCEKCF